MLSEYTQVYVVQTFKRTGYLDRMNGLYSVRIQIMKGLHGHYLSLLMLVYPDVLRGIAAVSVPHHMRRRLTIECLIQRDSFTIPGG